MRTLPSAGPLEKTWRCLHLCICAAVFVFLVGPLVIIIPLSFNAEPYFTFSNEMLALAGDGYSTRWYREFFASVEWLGALGNSFLIAACATLVSTGLGVMAALGLSSRYMPWRNLIMSLLISPMIAPLIISAAAMFFFYSRIELARTFTGVILAHAALGTPFVVITLTATLTSFNRNLTRAAASLGASPLRAFFSVVLPLTAPGVITGALFAFITSFDEVVVALFLAGPQQLTLPLQMWSGLREQISPVILAVACMLVALSILFLTTLELLRRRTENHRGINIP